MDKVEIIVDGGRRRRWNESDKLRIVEESLTSEGSISSVARRNGVPPNLLYRWRQLMLEGGSVAVAGDSGVTSDKEVRQLEQRIKELERALGKKTLEVDILKEAIDKSRSKKQKWQSQSLLTGGSV